MSPRSRFLSDGPQANSHQGHIIFTSELSVKVVISLKILESRFMLYRTETSLYWVSGLYVCVVVVIVKGMMTALMAC